MQLAKNTNRIIAYFIDMLPIVVIFFIVYYQFFGFDNYWHAYMDNLKDTQIRKDFLEQRNHIRNFSLITWVVYSLFMDATKWQGTLGKKLMNIKVTDYNGQPLNMRQSISRNLSKLISIVPLFIGMFWILFDKHNRAWHDMIGKTLVVDSRYQD